MSQGESGNQRAIPREAIPAIAAALKDRGWLPEVEALA